MARWLAEPIAGGAERVFLRVLAHQIEEVLEIVCRHARRGAHDQRTIAEQHQRREILHHVIGNGLVEERIDHVHRSRHQQRVAVGRRLGDGIGADDAGGTAGAIFDDEVLPDRLVELLHQNARDAIDRPARRKRHDDAHGARRIGLCRCGLLRRGKEPQQRAPSVTIDPRAVSTADWPMRRAVAQAATAEIGETL